MSMKKILFSLVALAATTSIFAQKDSTLNLLNEVVVTATKFPVKLSTTGKVLTVISRQQLERSEGKDLAQLLNEQAGISVNGANSNPGKDKAVYVRGAKSDYTLIAIDGVPVYDPSASYFDFRLMPLDNIERIEILKGSQSTLYGADAIAGVINIITKKGSNKTVSPYATLGFGTYNTVKMNAGINGGKQFFTYNIGYTHYKTDGFSESADKTNSGNFDKDGYEQNSLNANFGIRVNKKVSINPYLRYSKFNGRLDGDAFADDKDYTYNLKNMQAGVKTEWTMGKATYRLLYNYNNIQRNYLNDSLIKETAFDGYSTGNYTGKEHFAEAYISLPVNKQISFVGGVDYRNSNTKVHTAGIYKYVFDAGIYSGTYASNIAKDSAKQNQLGIYGALIYAGKSGFHAELGGRYNNHSAYGNNMAYNINPSYFINKQLKLFANISTAYKVPTLYQLYSEYHNPFTTLQPEKAISYEGGAQYYAANNLFTARVAVFNRQVNDAIAFYYDAATYASYFINQDKQNDWGFEIEPTINFKNKAQIILAYAHVDGNLTTKNAGKDTTYFNLLRRPKNTFSATFNYPVTKKLFASLAIRNFGKRADFDFTSYQALTLKAYWLVDIYAEYRFTKNIKFFADLKNITNTNYQELAGYNTLGRNINAGITIHF